jgi:hypothetical protein
MREGSSEFKAGSDPPPPRSHCLRLADSVTWRPDVGRDRANPRPWRQLQDFVATRIAGGQRFVDDLVKEPLASNDELAKAAGGDDAP